MIAIWMCGGCLCYDVPHFLVSNTEIFIKPASETYPEFTCHTSLIFLSVRDVL